MHCFEKFEAVCFGGGQARDEGQGAYFSSKQYYDNFELPYIPD